MQCRTYRVRKPDKLQERLRARGGEGGICGENMVLSERSCLPVNKDVGWQGLNPLTDSRQGTLHTETSILRIKRPWRVKIRPTTDIFACKGASLQPLTPFPPLVLYLVPLWYCNKYWYPLLIPKVLCSRKVGALELRIVYTPYIYVYVLHIEPFFLLVDFQHMWRTHT